jgi:hypothetical protein
MTVVFLQLKQYFDDSNFPEWTKSQAGITVPLTLPEKPASDFGQPRETACLMCQQVFAVPEREKDFLAHLVMLTHHCIFNRHRCSILSILTGIGASSWHF